MFHFIKKHRTRLIFVFCFALIALSCSQSEQPAKSNRPKVYIPSVFAKDFAPGQLEAHYQKHRYEFGDISMKDYLYGARALLNAQPDKDVLEKERYNGDILRYRLSTGEFAVMTKTGTIRTYFKTNYRYWLRQ